MTAITLPNSGLKAGYLDGEAGWGEGMNLNLRIIDALLHPRVTYKGLTTPPTGAASGAVYIVGASATGAWAGKADQLAIWMAGDDVTSGWAFVVPKEGWEAYVVDEAENYVFDGSTWVLESTGTTDPGTPTGLRNTVTTVTGVGSIVIDLNAGDYFKLTLSGNVTIFNFAGLPGAGKGASLMIHITQDAAPRTITWPASFRWEGAAPVISTAPGTIDLLAITTFDNGVTWHATLSKGRA